MCIGVYCSVRSWCIFFATVSDLRWLYQQMTISIYHSITVSLYHSIIISLEQETSPSQSSTPLPLKCPHSSLHYIHPFPPSSPGAPVRRILRGSTIRRASRRPTCEGRREERGKEGSRKGGKGDEDEYEDVQSRWGWGDIFLTRSMIITVARKQEDTCNIWYVINQVYSSSLCTKNVTK